MLIKLPDFDDDLAERLKSRTGQNTGSKAVLRAAEEYLPLLLKCGLASALIWYLVAGRSAPAWSSLLMNSVPFRASWCSSRARIQYLYPPLRTVPVRCRRTGSSRLVASNGAPGEANT
ncbi:hypothetical protein AO998_28580 [Pseudomonas aeruginosa]|uniref:hypothetical protein n=1 Tax=Pseudomonas aeruginosa TaxID=287 RepID=UPI00071BB3E5|nr:hypothetical protein [Pseudomonas aeruginosa]KSI95135.1 hypothetical protein AO998_28580 [Pseudomonas aeruginosa]